jgi:non-ribosomal peptide synthetase component F
MAVKHTSSTNFLVPTSIDSALDSRYLYIAITDERRKEHQEDKSKPLPVGDVCRSHNRSPLERLSRRYCMPILFVSLQFLLTLSDLAIHEIFESNAQKFPDRLCVIETNSGSTSQRLFTYRQINEASNQLAHHLLAYGCALGDVVMIYAYRGSVLPLPTSPASHISESPN